ncbi:MAG TPA: UDP-N-acetylmuramate dehydrogenase [Candidatus Pacearchaeota archaeon]|nr:UDP-N-acetylmuramate dehydrogenase [Candidatus Pacearchaeota archaeon]
MINKNKNLKILRNVSLKDYTTYKIGGLAKYFFIAENNEDLIEAIKWAKDKKIPFFILGNGSNVLFSDKGFNGLIIKIKTSKIEILKNKNNKCDVLSEAGVNLSDLINFLTENNLEGLEWAAGIPGNVGGAVYGNASAFGKKMSDFVKEVEVLDTNNLKQKKLSLKQCQFSAKNSIFKKKKNLVILSVVFSFKKGNKEEIKKRVKECLIYRAKNHPNYPSAGCVFKNYILKKNDEKIFKKFPELNIFKKNRTIPAAYLIEKCNLKGKQIGKAKISEKHSNFFVNLGGAKAKDILKLIDLTKKEVKNKFNIALEEEIIVINT